MTYREHDLVRIVTPLVFVKVGYDYGFDDEWAKVRESYPDLWRQLEKNGLDTYSVRHAIARESLRKRIKRGEVRGNRKLFTDYREDLKRMRGQVSRKYHVVTGDYVLDEEDGSYLVNRKCHTILEVSLWDLPFGRCEIESCNVESLQEDPRWECCRHCGQRQIPGDLVLLSAWHGRCQDCPYDLELDLMEDSM